MSGVLWALAAGAGFGLFQAINREAVRGMDVYVATFVQLVVSSIVLILISLATEDMSLLLLRVSGRSGRRLQFGWGFGRP